MVVNDDGQAAALIDDSTAEHPTRVTSADQLQVSATVERTIDGSAREGTVAASAAGGVAWTESKIRGSTRAFVGQNTQVGQMGQSAVGSMQITATADNSAVADAKALSLGLQDAGSGAVVKAAVTSAIQAYVGAGAAVTVQNDVVIETDSTADADADGWGVAVVPEIGSVGVTIADATASPDIKTYIGSGAMIAAGGSVTLRSTHTAEGVRAEAEASGGSLIVGGNGVKTDAKAVAMLDTYIGSSAQVTAGQTVNVLSTATNDATVEASSVTVAGALSIGELDPEAIAAGQTKAYLDNGASVIANGLNVRADACDFALATKDLRIGAAISISADSEAIAARASVPETTQITACIGDNAYVKVVDDVTILACSSTDADATSWGSSGGGANIHTSTAMTTVKPQVKSSIGAKATIDAGGNVTIQTRHGEDAETADGSFHPATDVDTAADIITIASHGLEYRCHRHLRRSRQHVGRRVVRRAELSCDSPRGQRGSVGGDVRRSHGQYR